jgi:hypothetical protein
VAHTVAAAAPPDRASAPANWSTVAPSPSGPPAYAPAQRSPAPATFLSPSSTSALPSASRGKQRARRLALTRTRNCACTSRQRLSTPATNAGNP